MNYNILTINIAIIFNIFHKQTEKNVSTPEYMYLPKGSSEAVTQRTYNTMAKTRTKGQALHRQLKIEQHRIY
jgi:hypothetical protein